MTDVGVNCLYTVVNKCQSTESVILQVHPTFTPPRPAKDQKKPRCGDSTGSKMHEISMYDFKKMLLKEMIQIC